jgi:hypothetical protein
MNDSEIKLCSLNDCNRKLYARNYCRKHYKRFLKHGNPHIVLISHHAHTSKVHLMKERFESNFTKSDDNSCWIWQGKLNPLGYGSFNLHIGLCKYKKVVASRLSYEYYNGHISGKMYVCHTCDTPSCVNPRHLYLGTARRNAQDMSNKGRSLYGEKNPRAKFTNAQAEEIRKLLDRKLCTMQYLANKHNVHVCTIKRIKYNKSYLNKDVHANIGAKRRQKARYWSKRFPYNHGLQQLQDTL